MNAYAVHATARSFAAVLLLCASVNAVATVSVQAVANPSKAAPGERVRYAVTVLNTGPGSEIVTLTARVPTGTTVAQGELSLAATCNGTGFTTCAGGQTLKFADFNVPVGASATVVYPALISTSAPPPNGTALRSPATASIGAIHLHTTASSTVNASAASLVHVTLSAFPAQALHLEKVTYTLTYGNPGSARVNANLSFALPLGTLLLSASDGGTLNADVVTWTLGTLTPGSAGRRTLVLESGQSYGTLAVAAVLRNPTTQAVLAHADLTTPISIATETTLNARVVATPDPAAPGQRARYAVTMSNTDAIPHDVLLTATVPTNTTVARNEVALGATCDAASFLTCEAGQTVQFGSVTVAPGASVTVLYPALISASTPPPSGTLLNSDVWMRDTTVGNEYQLSEAPIAASTAVSGVQLTVSALPAQPLTGENLAYTLTYGNPGSAAVKANLSFPLPDDTTFVSASIGGTLNAGVVTWTLGTLAPGSSGQSALVLQAGAAGAGAQLAVDAALANPSTQAELTHTGLTTPVGSATETVLNVTAVATPDSAPPGRRVRYAVTVSNVATAAHSVTLMATVPANTTVARGNLSLDATCDGAAFTTCVAGQNLEFDDFDVPAGASVTVVYPALISTSMPPANGTLLNSDVWLEDTSVGTDYQVSIAAIASDTVPSTVDLTTRAWPAQTFLAGQPDTLTISP
jgi:hypothetical protein